MRESGRDQEIGLHLGLGSRGIVALMDPERFAEHETWQSVLTDTETSKQKKVTGPFLVVNINHELQTNES